MNKLLRLPIGLENFGEIVSKKLDFVDKSLLIKAVLDDVSTKVIVLTRPRRFGKTLNLSMLQHFFANEAYGLKTKNLFDGLKITACGEEYLRHQGQYPVIFISLKDVRDHSFEHALGNLEELIRRIYQEHRSVLTVLDEEEKTLYHKILAKQAALPELQNSLRNLTEYLFRYTGQKPWLLIDEYDSPIQSAFLQGYYDEMISLIRNLFSAALKTNPYLEKSVITGILRIAKESLFSGLNNVEVYTLLNTQYGEYFGFTEEEVQSLLHRSGLDHDSQAIRNWYNGYQAGNTVIYNPLSIAKCIKEQGELQPYWVNTSDNQLIRTLLIRSSGNFKMHFEQLLQDHSTQALIDENMVFADLDKSETAVWSLLFMAGYLKVVSRRREDQGVICQLAIPNREVRNLYRQIIENWLSNGYGVMWYNTFLDHLLTGNFRAFSDELKQVMENIVSSHDTARDPEVFYHGLIIGLTASLYKNPNYEIHSNRESGYGRYDYLILSHDKNKPTLILEFKRVDSVKDPEQLERKLEQAAQEALTQIEQQHYLTEAQQRGYTRILKIGLAFCGKHFKLQTA